MRRFQNTFNTFWNEVEIAATHENLFEQRFSRGRRKLYHTTSSPILQVSDRFYGKADIPDEIYERFDLEKLQKGPPCIFLTPNIDFAYKYFLSTRQKEGWIYHLYLTDTIDLFNPDSSKDLDALKSYDMKLYNFYQWLLKTKQGNNKRAWMTIENANMVSAIKDMGYEGFNNYGYLPYVPSFPTAENLALFSVEYLKVVEKQKFNEYKSTEFNLKKDVFNLISGKVTPTNYQKLLKLVKNRLVQIYGNEEVEKLLFKIVPLIEMYYANNKDVEFAAKEVLPNNKEEGIQILNHIFPQEKIR